MNVAPQTKPGYQAQQENINRRTKSNNHPIVECSPKNEADVSVRVVATD
jgi:hypothetical protein